MHRLLQIISVCFLAMALAMGVSGCKPASPEYVESTSEYTAVNVAKLFERVPETPVLGQPADQSAALRHEALVGLRGHSTGAALAADLITETFPADTRGVPVFIERAQFEGVPALLLLELTGPIEGSLDDVRLWVVGENGSLLYSQVR